MSPEHNEDHESAHASPAPAATLKTKTSAHPLRQFYLHNSLKTLAEVCAGSFFLAYLYKAGFTFTQLAFTMAGVFALRFFFRLALRSSMEQLDLKRGLIISALIFPIRYVAIMAVHGVGVGLLFFMCCYALTEAIYNTFYHAYWTSIMHTTQSAAAFGTRDALGQVTQIVGSVVSGYFLATSGPIISFGLGACFAVLACLPLFTLPDRPTPKASSRPALNKKAISRIHRILAAEGFFSVGMGTLWPIALFKVADAQFFNFGLLLGIAAALYAVGDYVLGKHFDAVPKHWLAVFGAVLMFADLSGRALFGVSVPTIILFNLLASIASVAYYMAHSQMSYRCIEESGHPIRAAWHHESSWDVGAVAGLLVAAGATSLGMSPRMALMINALGALACGWFMFSYYRSQTTVATSGATPEAA